MGSYYWIKMYHEVLHDPKMGMLSDHLWRRFFELCLIAGEEQRDGYLPEPWEMAWTLRTTSADLMADLDELKEQSLVTMNDDGSWFVTKFAERQAALSDAERKARQRERDRRQEYYGHDPVTNDVTMRDTDIDTDTDQIQNRKNADSESLPDDDVVNALRSIDMDQIPNVIMEATASRLTAQQIIETCCWAKEQKKSAAIVRTMFRAGEARRPRAPADRSRYATSEYAQVET